MLERFKRSTQRRTRAGTGAVATADRPRDGHRRSAQRRRDRRRGDRREAPRRTTAPRPTTAAMPTTATSPRPRHAAGLADGNGAATTSALERARARQRDEFGGVNWGASFFGWLVAVGVAALLTALLAAAGAAIGLTATPSPRRRRTPRRSVWAAASRCVVVLMLAYYAGGYVAGRMSRFDGGRQGLGTWAIGLIVTVALAIAAVVLGDQYNVLEQLNLPSLPVGDQTLATGGIIAIAAIIVGTLLAAMFGGKVGERYHKRVDRAGFVD